MKGKWFLEFSFMDPKEYGMGSFPKTMHVQLNSTTEEEAVAEGKVKWQEIKDKKLFQCAISPHIVYKIALQR